MSDNPLQLDTVVFDTPVYVQGAGRKDTFTVNKGTGHQWVSSIWADGICVWLEHSGKTLVVPYSHVAQMYVLKQVKKPEPISNGEATPAVATEASAADELPKRKGRPKKPE